MPRRSSDPGSVLVTDSTLRTALYTVRNLGRHGVRITVAERAMPRRQDIASLSKYVSRRIEVPDNRTDGEAWADAILAAAPGHDVLLPMGMHAIVPIARRLDAFQQRTRVALPPLDVISRADNTPELLDLARQLDVPVPRQWKLSHYPNAAALAADATYPVFAKIGVESDLPPAGRYALAKTPQELVTALERLCRYNPEPIIQEQIAGDGIGFEALYDFEHRLVASFAHRRLREYPLTGGPSTLCESIHNERAERYSRTLLDALKWVGLAMVEFKIDHRTGTPILMEINPRPWGSIQLPIRAGVEFPWLWYLLARDGALPVQPGWKDGVKLRYLVNDLQAALASFKRAGSFGERLGIIGSLLDPRVKEGILSLTDPRPSLAYLAKGAGRAVGTT